MNYKDSIDYIDKLYIGKKKEPTLDRIKNALKALSFDYDLKVVHIAGTNGKGSTCSMIANVLRKSGYKVGLYTSPHLITINERIKINGVDISDNDFAKYVTRVVDAIEKNSIDLLFFEVVTAVAFLYFKDNKCDIVVLETGMGGEYDATNVIKNPLCTVITNIGLEHEDILGVGIDNIARAKAGIIKENVDCVVYDIKDGRKVFEDVAMKKCSKLHFVNFNNISYQNIEQQNDKSNKNSKITNELDNVGNKNNINNESNINNIDNINSIIFSYKNYNNVSTNLLGEYQVHNACVAIEALDILKEKGYKIDDNDIRDGLKSVKWPARFQVLRENNPKIILDGGHNPQCIDAIVKELKKYKDVDIVYVVSIVKDKNADLMAKELSLVSKKFVLTHIDNKRGMEERELKDIFLRYSDDVTYRYDIKDSIECAKEKINNNGIICIIGSLYFAGDLLKEISEMKG